MRLRVFLAILLLIWAGQIVLDIRVISAWTERAITREADSHAQAWTSYATQQLVRLDEIASRGQVRPEDYHLIDSLVLYSDVFRFKIYGPDGALRLVSDENMDDSLSLFSSRSIFDLLTGELVPVTVIRDGSETPFFPETYSQTIVPVIQGNRLVALTEVFVDQTARSAAIRAEFWSFGHLIAGLVTLPIALSALGIGILLRRDRRANEALRRQHLHAMAAERARGDFITTLDHELRNPLNGILGTVAMLREGTIASEDRHLVDVIEDNALTQKALIDDLLTASEADADALTLSIGPVDLHDFMRKVTSSAAVLAAKKGLRFTLCLEAPDVIIETDAKRLRQIVANLLTNAVKFTETGSITVRVLLDMGEYGVIGKLRIIVADTGIGIDPAYLNRVFERFVQLEPGRDLDASGTGLGLAISRAIAREMKGDISVQSEPGTGSAFTLTLPVAFRAKQDVVPEDTAGSSAQDAGVQHLSAVPGAVMRQG